MNSFLDGSNILQAILGPIVGFIIAFIPRYYRRWQQYRADALRKRREEQRYEQLSAETEDGKDGIPKEAIPAFEPRDLIPLRSLDGPYFYITDLALEQFRCFREASLSFRFPGEGTELKYPNVNLLLGDNGSGKSTILRAIAMSALAPILESSGFFPYRLIRGEEPIARLSAQFALGSGSKGVNAETHTVVRRRFDFESVTHDFRSKVWEEIYSESSSSFFVAGYGVNRRVGSDERSDPSLERGKRRRRYQRVGSLFDDSLSLVPLGSWLPGTSTRTQIEIEGLFRKLLPTQVKFTGEFEGLDPIFSRSGSTVPYRALSDGFRSYIGWLGDLLFQIRSVSRDDMRLTDVGGIVMVDEIDLLLHPSWQRIVVPTISQMFPNLQFIYTTHSPIVTGTLEANNIVVAKEEAEEEESAPSAVLTKIEAEVHGMSAEQVLLSSYFDLTTTRSPDVAPTLQQLARRALEGDEEARSEYLRALSEGSPTDRR